MTTKLRLSYPDVTVSSLNTAFNAAMHESLKGDNLFAGEKGNYARLNAVQSALEIVFDLGDGKAAAADHLIIGRAKAWEGSSITNVSLMGGASTTFTAPYAFSMATFNQQLYKGPEGDDWIGTFSKTSAYRYWRFVCKPNSGSQTCGFSKLFFGTLFDIGTDPDSYDYQLAPANTGEVLFPTGNILITRTALPRYVFSVRWKHVTEALTQAFVETFLRDPQRNYVYLYTTDNDQILADNQLVYCRILSDQCVIEKSFVEDWNTITAYFEQVL